MADLKVCRICLRKGGKVYNYDSFNLKQYYEGIMGKKVSDIDSLPKYFCYQCAAFLYKYHKFKEKCLEGEKNLVQLLWTGTGVITLSAISQIDRQEKNLKSTIGLMSGRKRVRTIIVTREKLSKNLREDLEKDEITETEHNEVDCESNGETLSKNLREDFKKDEILEIEVSEVDYESDNSMDDKNLAVVKNEMINEKPTLQEDEQTIIVGEINTEEIPELGDDRMFSDDDDSWLAAYKIGNPDIRKAITIAEQATLNTEQGESVNKTVPNEKPKAKKRRKAKRKKFEVEDSGPNYLDPKHWLKVILTEEEALEEFRKKALERRYTLANYQCTDCYRGFSEEEMLNRHRLARHSETIGPQECRFCHQRFKFKHLIETHLQEHFNKYKCLRCDLVCSLKTSAVFHNDYHNGVTRTCMHCKEEFRHLSTYYTHLRTHRSEHVCTLCGASFVSAAGLRYHIKRMHKNTVVNPEEADKTYCQECDIKFETRKAFDEHKIHSSKHAVGVELLAFETPAPSLPKKLRKKGYASRKHHFTACDFCNKLFCTKMAYKRHHLEEHQDIPLPETLKETEPPRQVCEICGISLKPASMATHLNTHTREIIYTCATCGMQFNSKASMNRHQLTHTGEKPYPCSMCDKRFTQKGSMMLHFRTIHLKQPYPKRNRKRKADDEQEIEEYRINKDNHDSNEYW